MNQAERNLVEQIGEYTTPCGYCQQGRSAQQGMLAHTLSCEVYQELLNRGWRRAGLWLYRPLAEHSDCRCSRAHTIRLDVHEFQPSKAQRKVQRKFDAYLEDNMQSGCLSIAAPVNETQSGAEHTSGCDLGQSPSDDRKRKSSSISKSPPASPGTARRPTSMPTACKADAEQPVDAKEILCRAICRATQDLIRGGLLPTSVQGYPKLVVSELSEKKRCRSVGSHVAYTTAAAFAIAAGARRARGQGEPRTEEVAAQLAQRIAEILAEQTVAGKYKLQVEAQQGHLNFSKVPLEYPTSLQAASDGQPSQSSTGCIGAVNSADCWHNSAALALTSTVHRATAPPARAAQRSLSTSMESQHETVGDDQSGALPQDQATVDKELRSCKVAELSATPDASDAICSIRVVSSSGTRCADAASSARGGPACSRSSGSCQQDSQTVPQEQACAANRGAVAGPGPQSQVQHAWASKRRFEVRQVAMPAGPDVVAHEYPLYRKYQIMHHGDSPHEVRESSFKRFLVDSPLRSKQAVDSQGKPIPLTYGSFHQQYYVDGQLIAVGVVDVLPQCLSSVYFFWDPSLSALSLGKLSALKEIAFAQAASCICPDLHYYYMGYYIHSCPKMRYKADYQPSSLLCMRSLAWVPFDIAAHHLDKDSQCVLSKVQGLEAMSSSKLEHKQGSQGSHTWEYEEQLALDNTMIYLVSRKMRGLIQLGHLKRLARTPETLEKVRAFQDELGSWAALAGPVGKTIIHVMVSPGEV